MSKLYFLNIDIILINVIILLVVNKLNREGHTVPA